MAKISIIVPIFNSEKYLKKCIDSIINQSLREIEIILINDGSNDNSENIIKEFKDPRIVYIKQKNKGIGKTRNLGIKKSTGEYLAFVDSDDYLELDFCKKMYEKAKKNNCDIVMCDFYKEKYDGKLEEINFEKFTDTNLTNYPNLLNKINLGPCNKIYSRDFILNNKILFEENLKYEDVIFVLKAFVLAQKIGKVNKYLTFYVIHSNSETTTRDDRIYDILKICEKILDFTKKYHYLENQSLELITMILTDYNIQTRYINSLLIRNKFIDKSFSFLDKYNKNWKNTDYIRKYNIFKRLIKTNKVLTKLYCTFYNISKK